MSRLEGSGASRSGAGAGSRRPSGRCRTWRRTRTWPARARRCCTVRRRPPPCGETRRRRALPPRAPPPACRRAPAELPFVPLGACQVGLQRTHMVRSRRTQADTDDTLRVAQQRQCLPLRLLLRATMRMTPWIEYIRQLCWDFVLHVCKEPAPSAARRDFSGPAGGRGGCRGADAAFPRGGCGGGAPAARTRRWSTARRAAASRGVHLGRACLRPLHGRWTACT